MRLHWLLCGICALALSGCAMPPATPVTPAHGLIYSDIKAPLDADFDETNLGSKMGEAEIVNYLGAVAMGDASIKAAAENGGITTINHVDYHSYNILGVYTRFKVIVYGD